MRLSKTPMEKYIPSVT